jgi:hypothetical protein
MRKGIVILLVLVFSKSFAQYPIIKDSIRNPGIYRTFEEFRNNAPSIKLEYKIDVRSDQYGGVLGFKSSSPVYGLNINENVSNRVGPVFGFCDGKQIYVAFDDQDYMHFMNFYKLDYIGRYCYFDFVSTSTMPMGGGLISSNSTVTTRVIDMATGKSSLPSKKLIRSIISDKPELLKRYEADQAKRDHFKAYLVEYLKS